MSYRAHVVSRCEEYGDGSYFNRCKDELENLFSNLGEEFFVLEDDPNRTEISVEDMEKVMSTVTAEDIEEAGMFKNSPTPMDKNLSMVKQYLKEIYDQADKSYGTVQLVWF